MSDRGSGPHVFVDDLDHPVLGGDDRHHLTRSLRLRAGAPLTISDGRGRWRTARFGDVVEPVGEVRLEPEPERSVVVGFAPVKGQRPEWAVQKLTELGVDAIWLLVAERSVVRWDGERATGHAERLRRIVREAAMQSRRCRLPEVRTGVRPVDVVAPGVALADPGGGRLPDGTVTLVVGPEGGWTDDERALGAPTVGLGPTVLRTETAAVAAGVLLCALRAGTLTLPGTDGG